MLMLEYRYDTQLLIDGEDLDEDAISDYFTENLKGDCLLAVGGGPLVIVVEDIERQARGLKG